MNQIIEINAIKFGMTPETENNYNAFIKAIVYCKENKVNRLVINPGDYYFEVESSFSLENMINFEIYAPDVRFIYHKNFSHKEQFVLFEMKKCNHMKFTGLSIDWNIIKSPTVSMVKAISVTDSYVDLEYIEDGEIPEKSHFISLHPVNPDTLTIGIEDGMEYNLNGNMNETFLKRERISEKVYRCYFDPNGENTDFPKIKDGGERGNTLLKENTHYLIRHYSYHGGAFEIRDCNYVTFEDFWLHSIPGSGLDIGGDSSHFTFNRFHIAPPKNERRYMTTTVDGIFINGYKGYFLMEDSEIGYQGDDCINIHNRACKGLKRISEDEYSFSLNAELNVGDLLMFTRPNLSKIDYDARIDKKEKAEDCWIYTMNKPLSKEIENNTTVHDMEYDAGHFCIRNSRFHENRARGLIIQASEGIIENCEFYRIQSAAIQIMTVDAPTWSEGRGVQNVIVRNNRFIECDVNDWDRGVVYVSSNSTDGIPIKNTNYPKKTSTVGVAGGSFRTKYPVFHNLCFENNVFEEYPGRAMILSSFDGITLKNNVFRNNVSRIHNNVERGSILVVYGKNLFDESNTFETSEYMKMPCIEEI